MWIEGTRWENFGNKKIGEEKEIYLKIRRGEFDRIQLESEIHSLIKYIEKECKKLPKEINTKVLNDWLIQFRKRTFVEWQGSEYKENVEEGPQDLKKLGEKMLQKYKINGTIIMVTPSGSQIHRHGGNKEIKSVFFDLEKCLKFLIMLEFFVR